MLQIDSSKVKGEPGTGYEPPGEKGPFQCSNCNYFRGGSCGQPTMMERSQLPHVNDGRVKVDPAGCCEYVDRRDPAKQEARRKFATQTKARGRR